MKNQKKWLALCLFFVACSPDPDPNLDSIVQVDLSPPAAERSEPPPPGAMEEHVKFAPPNIKDDAVDAEQFDENGDSYTGETTKSDALASDQKIVKTAYMTIRVDSAEISKVFIDSLVNKYKCRYEQENFENDWTRKTFNLQIRIPTLVFTDFISALEKGKGDLENKQISEEDVTANYVDLESRLKTKRQFINRYYELLKKATTVKSMLEIEENLRGLQEEIDAHESRLKHLSSQVNYSTLNLNLYKEKLQVTKPVELPGFLTSMRNALVSGFNTILFSMYWFVQKWPLVVLILFCLLFLKRFLKRRKKPLLA